MTDEEPPGRRAGSGRLWTDPREEEEHTQWLVPKTAPAAARPLAEPEEEPPGGPERRLWPLVLLGTLIAIVLFGIGILGASLLRGDDSSGSLAALPAAPGAVAPDARARTVRQVYASVKGGIVRVEVQAGLSKTTGTGFLIDAGEGTLVTAAHVVSGADRVQVRFGDSNSSAEADVLGTDETSDLAVLRVDSSSAKGHNPLPLADSDNVKVGDLALAIGYPLGLDETVTQGIISGIGRAIQAPNGFSIDKVIQTQAPINPGNSGGPLLDAAGRVIGVNTQIATPPGGSGNVGIGFAVPSNTVRQVVPRLRVGGTIRRPYLGITSEPNPAGPGALVSRVHGGSPAERGGLLNGDVVTAVEGHAVRTPEDVSRAIINRRPGDEVDVQVERGGARRTLGMTLGTQPKNVLSPSAGP